ncbi:Quinidine resistance protein 1 [Sphaceloma murrayae]|uniref:Quinidine resistance protein 1 n=1 Tax=Sphaceloma murrayae TaxID=2082308 RepID=A0A2K1QXS7_9PEZI|nr:Quinidine resistance protein 1 [Sphaceloma murrayae]
MSPEKRSSYARSSVSVPSTAHTNAPVVDTGTERVVVEYSTWRKACIVLTTSWMAFTTAFSSAALFPAIPNIASDLETSTGVIYATNAGVFICLGLSAFIWLPLMHFFGRRKVYYTTGLVFLALSIATALAPTIHTWIVVRCLSHLLQGTVFHIAGQAVLADIFVPTQRGTAIGCFLIGTVSGPALGPCIGGLIVTFANWRAIFWVQTGMVVLGLLLTLLTYPSEVEIMNPTSTGPSTANPLHILTLFRLPNLALSNVACALISFSQYSLLVAPRHIINPRFGLTTPLVSGLFYLSPLSGFILGTLAGGRYSDHVVRSWTNNRGRRVSHDRLRAGKTMFFLVIPASALVYGWCLQTHSGGLLVPIVAAFFQAAGLFAALSGVNTYCVEAVPERRMEVVAGKYFAQYGFGGAAAAGGMVPLIDAVGIGAATTIGVGMVLVAGVLVGTVAHHGEGMVQWAEKRKEQSGLRSHETPPRPEQGRTSLHVEDA